VVQIQLNQLTIYIYIISYSIPPIIRKRNKEKEREMAGGAFAPTSRGKEYPGKLTFRVFFTCLFAATGGLIFCYDLGILGV
jgi:hypothetical protein